MGKCWGEEKDMEKSTTTVEGSSRQTLVQTKVPFEGVEGGMTSQELERKRKEDFITFLRSLPPIELIDLTFYAHAYMYAMQQQNSTRKSGMRNESIRKR